MSKQPALFKGAPEKKPLESVVLKWIKAYLRARNIFHVRINSGRIRTQQGHWVQLAPEGTPDLYVLYKGVSLWVEAKREGEKPRAEQLRQHEFIRQSGGVVIVAESVEDVRAALMNIDKEKA